MRVNDFALCSTLMWQPVFFAPKNTSQLPFTAGHRGFPSGNSPFISWSVQEMGKWFRIVPWSSLVQAFGPLHLVEMLVAIVTGFGIFGWFVLESYMPNTLYSPGIEIQSVTSNVIGQDQSFSSKQQVRGLSHDSNTTVLHPLIFNMVHTPNLPSMFLCFQRMHLLGLVRKLRDIEWCWYCLFFCCNSCCLLFRKTTIENERYLWSMSGSTLELTHNHGAEMDENFKVPTTPGWFKGLIYIYIQQRRWKGWECEVLCKMDWHLHMYALVSPVYAYIACINWGLTKPCNIVLFYKNGKGSSPMKKGPSLTFTIGCHSIWAGHNIDII